MKENRIPVITINREYGAGGRSLAAILSEKLGIPYYDRDFVSKTVEESGFDEEDVEREGEELSRSSKVIRDLFNTTVSYMSSHDAIFEAEKKLILKLAAEPCIIVGRCADRILAGSGIDCISIYLHAPLKIRLRRAEELPEKGTVQAEKFIEKRDSQRRTFYKQYTGCDISDAANYTFCFDTGKISIASCAEMVLAFLKED